MSNQSALTVFSAVFTTLTQLFVNQSIGPQKTCFVKQYIANVGNYLLSISYILVS